MIGSSDGLPLSKSSKIDLYPKVLFIKNFKNKNLIKKLIVFSTFTLFIGDNKCDRDLIVQSMVDEFEKLKDGFVTAWSNNTKIKYTAFVADKEREAKEQSIEHVCGIKGSTPLLQLDGFDIVNDVIFDIMHCGFLGVYRHLIESYLNLTSLDCFIHVNHKRPSKPKIIELIDNQIKMIKHPSSMSRKLRSIKEQSHYKCSVS